MPRGVLSLLDSRVKLRLFPDFRYCFAFSYSYKRTGTRLILCWGRRMRMLHFCLQLLVGNFLKTHLLVKNWRKTFILKSIEEFFVKWSLGSLFDEVVIQLLWKHSLVFYLQSLRRLWEFQVFLNLCFKRTENCPLCFIINIWSLKIKNKRWPSTLPNICMSVKHFAV